MSKDTSKSGRDIVSSIGAVFTIDVNQKNILAHYKI